MRLGPIGIWELLIILALVLLVFGPRRLPEMAKGLGQAVREFRKGIRDMKKDFDDEVGDDHPKAAAPTATVPVPPAPVTPAPVSPAPVSAATNVAPEQSEVKTPVGHGPSQA